jgi:hypothetical protein
MGTYLNITKGISLKNESKSYFAISQLQKNCSDEMPDNNICVVLNRYQMVLIETRIGKYETIRLK